MLRWLCLLPLCSATELAIGIFGEFTSWYMEHLAVVVAFDFDLRKNFEPVMQQRFGPPIVAIPDLHPQVANVKVRVGTTDSNPAVGVGTALDFMFGMDGETPVVALVGGSSSSITMPVASVAGVMKVPQISWSATSPSLSDKAVFPFFLRTAPPDSIQGRAFWQWILNFEVPRVACLYSVEPYGQGLYLAISEQAAQAGQSSRLIGVKVRYMPVNFVVEEGRAAVLQAKSSGTRFLFIVMNGNTLDSILPLMEEEQMLGPEWQVVSSEALGSLPTLPKGFMRWNPASQGPKYPQFQQLWANMTADDVFGTAARNRYKLDNFRVPLADATVPTVTDATFQTDIVDFSSQLFDACYVFIFAINELLNNGTALADIKSDLLLQQLQKSNFEGVSGQVSFDANGDRQAAYELLNHQPSGWQVIGTFSASTGQMTVATEPYWMFGVSSFLPPSEMTSCSEGLYKDAASQQCLPCPRGFYCTGGAPQQCARGYFSNVTGAASCTVCRNGTFAGEAGSTQCTACQPGFFGAMEGQEACAKCPKGQFTPFYESLSCMSCGMGMVTEESGAQEDSECQCAAGFFLCNHTGCLACPEGLSCPAGLALPRQSAGYWTPEPEPEQCDFRVLRCRAGTECPSLAALGQCAEGREGVACNNCKKNHYPLEDGTCARCNPVDFLPAVLCMLVALIVVTLLVNCMRVDLNQQSLNLLTVAAVGGQMVTAMQTLGSVRQLSIEWMHPVRHIIELTSILTFDLDLIKISCIFGRDSPTLVFVGQLLVCPLGMAFFLFCWLISRCRGGRLSWDAIFNLSGILMFALFISITLVVLDPLRCQANPDGSSSMVSNPGILCFNSGEHIGLFVLAVIGIICYPLAILSWATYTTLRYPARVASGRGLQLVHRHRFLFQRFKTDRYYYGAVLLWRNCLVAVFPVIFGPVPEVQMQLLGGLMIFCGALQVRLWPWRTDLANYMDLVISSILQVVLLGVAPMLEHDNDTSLQVLGYVLTVAVLSPLLAGLCCILYSVLRHFRPEKFFGIFLCHHKGGAGSLCRLLKLLVAKHSRTEVFLDSDQLEDLDLIFDTIRAKTKSVVVVLTPELLKRMWCAGEIVTAFKNKVRTVPLICDGYEKPDETFMEGIDNIWTTQQKQILANHGITMDDVRSAYHWLRDDLTPLRLSRFGSAQEREEVVYEMLQRAATGMKLFRPSIGRTSKVKARILITGSVSDAEALATLEVFQLLVQKVMQKECVVVRSARELLAYRPWAYYFVVLFSRGILLDGSFAETLLSSYMEGSDGDETPRRPLEMVTVSADTSFEFPSPQFLTDLEQNGLGNLGPELGPDLSKAYRALLNVLALPLSPMGSEGLLEKQVSEICRRFRRYKNSAFALALDDEDDQQIDRDGVDPEELRQSEEEPMDMFQASEVRKTFKRIGKSLAWTEAGALVELEDLQLTCAPDPSLRQRAGSIASVPSLDSSVSQGGPLVSVRFSETDSDGPVIKQGF